MPDKTEVINNSERLLMHLDEKSLAARLVRAHQNRDPAHPSASIKAVLQERIEQVRGSFDVTKD